MDGPDGALLLPVEVDYGRPFPGSNHAAWEEEYLANVQADEGFFAMSNDPRPEPPAGDLGLGPDRGLWDDFLADELAGIGLTDPPRSISDDTR